MRIAVTAAGPSLEAEVDPRFGRCPFFLFVETEDWRYEAVENGNVTLGGGAGIQSAQLVAEKGVECILTGNCGPNAYRTLEAAGIRVVVGCSGTVRRAVEGYLSGAPAPIEQPNVASHFGMRGAASPSAAGGQSGGGATGTGRGTGRGMGRASAGSTSSSPVAEEGDLAALKREADSLGQHLKQVEERIREMEQGTDR